MHGRFHFLFIEGRLTLDLLKRLLWPSGPGAFRLWLALVVVLHHYTRIELGKMPVLVFFALSGFWIQRMWQTRYAAARRPYVTFLVSRWWRIAPMMVLSSLMMLVVLAALGLWAALASITSDAPRQMFSTLFGLGYALLPARLLGPGWSLDIEMQFYLAAPLLILAVRRQSAVIALGLALAVQALGLIVWGDVVLTTFLPWFVIGMVSAQHDWKPAPGLARASLLAAIGVTAGVWLSPWRALLIAQDAPQWAPFNMALAMLLIPFAMATVQRRGDRTDAVMADQSYVVYLMHWPVIVVFRQLGGLVTGSSFGDLLVFAGAVCALSWAAWRWFDRPLNRLRSRWVGKRLRQREADALPDATKEDDSSPLFA
ncbi:MAG: acyltransferase [Novosphingobium sp.]